MCYLFQGISHPNIHGYGTSVASWLCLDQSLGVVGRNKFKTFEKYFPSISFYKVANFPWFQAKSSKTSSMNKICQNWQKITMTRCVPNHRIKMSRVGFEHMPFWAGTCNWHLRLLGHPSIDVIFKISNIFHRNFSFNWLIALRIEVIELEPIYMLVLSLQIYVFALLQDDLKPMETR